MSESEKVVNIKAPLKQNIDRAEQLLALYREGKIDGLVIMTGTEDASMDAMFCDSPSDCHTARTLFAACHVIANHLLKKIE